MRKVINFAHLTLLGVKYRFTRLPFGIKTSGDIFNQVMTNIYEGLEGVATVIDDIIVHGATIEEHDMRVCKMLEQTHEVGLKLKP